MKVSLFLKKKFFTSEKQLLQVKLQNGKELYAILTDLYYMYLGRLHSRTTTKPAMRPAVVTVYTLNSLVVGG